MTFDQSGFDFFAAMDAVDLEKDAAEFEPLGEGEEVVGVADERTARAVCVFNTLVDLHNVLVVKQNEMSETFTLGGLGGTYAHNMLKLSALSQQIARMKFRVDCAHKILSGLLCLRFEDVEGQGRFVIREGLLVVWVRTPESPDPPTTGPFTMGESAMVH